MVTGANTNSASQATLDSHPLPLRKSDNRRSNKPIMEKRRRARINNCLNELKSLILDAMKKDPARHSKLEKADILEMTVKHLENMHRQQVALAAATDPKVLNKFRAGFTECAGEVGRFPGLEPPVKRRLLQHLANCLNSNLPTSDENVKKETRLPSQNSVQVTIVPEQNIVLSATNLQLVPTRLANGDIALVLPSSQVRQCSPPPLSVRTPPTPEPPSPDLPTPSLSPMSSPPLSPPPHPISLVVEKKPNMPEEKPWRPW